MAGRKRPAAEDIVRKLRRADVLAVGDVGLLDREVGVGEERVIPPHREQRVAVVLVHRVAAALNCAARLR